MDDVNLLMRLPCRRLHLMASKVTISPTIEFSVGAPGVDLALSVSVSLCTSESGRSTLGF